MEDKQVLCIMEQVQRSQLRGPVTGAGFNSRGAKSCNK